MRTEHDFLFLSSKYKDYIVPHAHSQVVAVVSCGFQYIGEKVPHFSFLEDVTQRFGAFSEFFRKVLMGVLHTHDGALLHASSIVYRNSGMVFMGHEGAGKTTIRMLLSKYICLGDDTAIIRIKKGKAYLYGSPLYQRTKRTYPNKRVLIKGIFALRQASHNVILELPFEKQMYELSRNVLLSGLQEFTEEQKLLSKTLFLLTHQGLVRELFFMKSPSVEKVITAFGKHSLADNRIQQTLSRSNIDFRQQLQVDFMWKNGLADSHFLSQCLIIREQGWVFEFGQERRLAQVAKKIIVRKEDSYHRSWVLKKLGQFQKTGTPPTISIIAYNKKFIIVDGNHAALAWYILSQKKKVPPARLLIGTLSSDKLMSKQISRYL